MSELFKGARRIVTAHARYFSPDLALTGRTRRGVPDHPGTRAHDDKRNGTARLMAARDGATGKLTGRMVARHHSEKLLDLVSGGQARNAGTVVGDSVDSGEALDARLGYRIEPDAPHAEDLSVDFWAEPPGSGAQEHGLGMDLNWQW